MRKLTLRLPRDRAIAASAIRTARSLLRHGPLARTYGPVFNLAASMTQSEANVCLEGREAVSLGHVAWMLGCAAEKASIPDFVLTDAALERINS